MPLSKVTDTVSGVAGDSILILDQYSVRAQMALQTSQHATTHRASAGFLRTLTTATPHGMGPGEAFMVSGAPWYYRTHGDGYQMLFQVVSVPAPNQVTYYAHTTSDEATTADTTGVVYRLGWRRLRVGMRCAMPTTAAPTLIQHCFGIGVSQGAHPVASSLCERFVGIGNVDAVSTSFYPSGPSRFVLSGSCSLISTKQGPTWTPKFTPYGTGDRSWWAATRVSPGLVIVEYSPYYVGTDHTCYFAGNVVSVCTNHYGLTSEHLKTFLRHPENFGVSVPSGFTVLNVPFYFTGQSASWDPAFGTFPVYLEAFNRSAEKKLEIMDIGYAFLL